MRIQTLTHHITKQPIRMLVFDKPEFERNGKQYRIIATRLASGQTWHTIVNEANETKEMEMQEMIKWLGVKEAAK
jgi:hypothetical protein